MTQKDGHSWYLCVIRLPMRSSVTARADQPYEKRKEREREREREREGEGEGPSKNDEDDGKGRMPEKKGGPLGQGRRHTPLRV